MDSQAVKAAQELGQAAQGFRDAIPAFKARVLADRDAEIARLTGIAQDAGNSRLKRAFAASLVRKLSA